MYNIYEIFDVISKTGVVYRATKMRSTYNNTSKKRLYLPHCILNAVTFLEISLFNYSHG